MNYYDYLLQQVAVHGTAWVHMRGYRAEDAANYYFRL